MPAEKSNAEKLCLACGLCCNGVIFADVQLQSSDKAARLQALGLRFKSSRSKLKTQKPKFLQPCAAFQNCSCQIYKERPKHCRQFECALLKDLNTSSVSFEAAATTVRGAHRRVERVRRLLRKLGDEDESLALGKRFQKMKRRLEGAEFSGESADLYGQLTLAMHQLNVLLSEKFYPGD